jgi:hypothetical protein
MSCVIASHDPCQRNRPEAALNTPCPSGAALRVAIVKSALTHKDNHDVQGCYGGA